MSASTFAGLQLPAPPKPGESIGVVAPSGPFPVAAVFRAMGWLKQCGFKLWFDPSFRTRHGYLAGQDGRRAKELEYALNAKHIRAVVMARGGYGLSRILPSIDWSGFRAQPKRIMGFSDGTLLHHFAQTQGVASLHGPNLSGLGADRLEPREQWLRCLASPGGPTLHWRGLRCLHSGQARGPIFGGNLCMVETLAAMGRWRIPKGAVVALEEVTELPYRIDRMLTSLLCGGHLDNAAAIVVGGLTACGPGRDGVVATEVLQERLSRLGIPVVLGAPFGHDLRNEPFALGAVVQVDASAGEVSA